MNLLAIETATPVCAMGVRTSSGQEASLVVDGERHHTEALTPGIERLLRETGLRADSIDRVVVDRGPGLFTGLRVGIATAVGFALATGAQLVGLTSLELLAHGARRAGVSGVLVCAVDGRRGELFTQSFELGEDARELDEPAVTTPADLVERWRADTSVTFTGDGIERYPEIAGSLTGSSVFEQTVPSPIEALMLGSRREPASSVVPLYLREADAIANFSTRERRP